jgi:UDP-N-acetylmuramate: L-alanyl-gamma-D-glutamyl-meso-diaminopimelate ligase
MTTNKGHLYFIGITGHTMRGLALAARELGYTVTGLDEPAEPPGSTWVDEHHFTWWRKFELGQLDDVTAVIVTGAYATDDYPAIVEARRRHISIKSYAQLWGEFTTGEHIIDVAGTHGKTTTTSLITWLLESAAPGLPNRHPTV